MTNRTVQCEIMPHSTPATAPPLLQTLPLDDVGKQQTAITVLFSDNSGRRFGRQQCDTPCDTILSSLLCYYQNVHGLRSKVADFALEASSSLYDCIVLTETWLDSDISSSQLFGMDYTVYRTDRCLMNSTKARGGGVLIAVRRSLASALLIQAMDDSLEQLWVTIKIDKLNVVIGAIYIPPNLRNEVEIIDRHISSVERAVNSTCINDDVLIFGDYNRAGLSWSIHTDGNYLFVDALRSSVNAGSTHLLDGMAFQCMHQINPVCNQNGRFLDLIFVNSHALPACSVTTAPDPLCNIDVHHPPLMVSFDRPVEALFIDEFDSSRFDFRRGNYDAIESELRSPYRLIHRHIPKARPRRKPIWGNRHLTKLNRLRKSALRAYQKNRNPINRTRFTSDSRSYKTLNKSLYTMFVRKTERNLRLNPKSFWRFVNSKRKEEGLPSSVFLLNSEASTNNSKCDLFAEHFASVFNKEHASPNDIAAAMASMPSDVFNAEVFEIIIGEVSKAICDLKHRD
ncbi:uncharacterized protein LOC129717151 [Wyeomyia smithii]|uniref:uncharacterized protein LOC129717151 n=1 Tax=Wyeomyia smithii TaxID=174621 RepID=UPI002468170C|nr:uncharacterized protein LOC129717151 [Wyeomyia smithii]